MSGSIIPQLIRKDFLLMRSMVLVFCFISIISVIVLRFLYGAIPNWALMNIAFFMLLGPIVACGIVALMKTNVLEKEKSTQIFIMSLPVTIKEFTIAKLLVNIYIFGGLWLLGIVVSCYFSYGLGLLPFGTFPFLVITFSGVFVAYTCILSVSLLFQNLAATIASIVAFELFTCVYLWIIAFTESVNKYIYGQEAVWNTTTNSIILAQVFFALASIILTLYIQGRKQDFI